MAHSIALCSSDVFLEPADSQNDIKFVFAVKQITVSNYDETAHSIIRAFREQF